MIRFKTIFIFLCIAVSIPLVNAQTTDTIDLYTFYKMVRQHAPQSGLLELNNQGTNIEIDKINAGNLPILTGYGKASYQSDVTNFSINIPNNMSMEVDMDKFQYNAGINIDQKLFDGGLVAVQKDIKLIEGNIKNLETETSLYKLNELVNKYFFGIITMQKSVEILDLRKSSLNERKKNVESGVQNGMVLKSELDRIESEILSTNQQITDILIARKQMENNLKILAGIESTTGLILKIPDNIPVNDSVSRCELELFQQNRNYANALIRMQNKRYVPRLYAYGQAGYSYPGLNMFENEAAPYYIIGAKLSWQIFDWNLAKKEKQLLEILKDRVNISETNFQRNLHMSVNSENEELEKMQQLILDDEKIIQARAAITKSSASALDNGTITTADYINDLNSELKARFDYERHKIALSESTARLAVLKGIDIENF